MVRLTETTLRSTCRCFSTMKLQRTSMCLLRLRKRFSFERATADSQSSYMMVGWVCVNPSSLASLRRNIASCKTLDSTHHSIVGHAPLRFLGPSLCLTEPWKRTVPNMSAIISLSATLSAISGVFVLRHEIGPLLHMKSHPMELARCVLSCDLMSAKLASVV